MHKTTNKLQFILTEELSEIPPEYISYRFSSKTILFDEKYSTLEFKDKNNKPCAVAIGYIFVNGNSTFTNSCDFSSNSFMVISSTQDIEQKLLPVLSGAYILLTFGTLPNRLYMDHGGSIPVVYDTLTGDISTTPVMLLDNRSYKQRFNQSLYDSLVGSESLGGWISGTLTAHKDIYRLLPNFFLDIDTMEQFRHWPCKWNQSSWLDIDQAVSKINNSLKTFTTAAIRTFRGGHTLTAGYDSRLLLAACQTIKDQCHFFTIDVPGAYTDKFIAQKLSCELNIHHQLLKLQVSSQEEEQVWDKAVGHCVNEINKRTYKSLTNNKISNFIFTGMYGEIGRCRLYRQDYTNVNELPINAEIIQSRLTIPKNKIMTGNIERWLSTLTGNPNSVIFDLAFLELKFGSWAMGQNPIQNSYKFGLLPFAQRDVLDAFIRVHPREKTTHNLFDKCIKAAWPELSNYPINSAGKLKDIQYKLSKLFNPVRVNRYMRDRLARLKY